MLQTASGTLDVSFFALVEPIGEIDVQPLQRRNLRLYVRHGLCLLDILYHLDDARLCVGGLLLVVEIKQAPPLCTRLVRRGRCPVVAECVFASQPCLL